MALKSKLAPVKPSAGPVSIGLGKGAKAAPGAALGSAPAIGKPGKAANPMLKAFS